jgi:large subunit ribosomal protein L7e
MAPPKPDQPALIPENVLKRKNDLDALHRKRLALEEVRGSKRTKPKSGAAAVAIIKPETILAKARNRRNNIRRVKRVQAKGMQKRAANKVVHATKVVHAGTPDESIVPYKANSFDAKMVFCIRIRNNDCIPKQVKHILDTNGLRHLHDGVFLRYDNDVLRRQLHLCEPWIVYGPPTAAAVKELLERRGYAKIKGERIALSDNTVVETALQNHVLTNGGGGGNTVDNDNGDNKEATRLFDIVKKFLWPFRLADTKTKFERTVLKLKDGKDYGDKGEAIQEYIAQVL